MVLITVADIKGMQSKQDDVEGDSGEGPKYSWPMNKEDRESISPLSIVHLRAAYQTHHSSTA